MEVIVLGSGAFAHQTRNPSGYAVRVGDGRKETILLDFGFGNLRQLTRAGISPETVSHLFFTHLHPDHTGDLPAILFRFRYDEKPLSGSLTLLGPPVFLRFLKNLKKTYSPWITPRGYKLRAQELSGGDRMRRKNWRLETLPVPHTTPALAFKISSHGKNLVYTGDTAFDMRIAEFARGSDLFILECTCQDSRPHKGHLTVSQALKLIEKSGCRRALLSHLSLESEKALSSVRKRLRKRNIFLARDFLSISL